MERGSIEMDPFSGKRVTGFWGGNIVGENVSSCPFSEKKIKEKSFGKLKG